jgi:hypothetical protein
MSAIIFKKSVIYGIVGALLGVVYAFVAVVVLDPVLGVELQKIHLILAPLLLGTVALLIGRHAEVLEEAKKRFSVLTHKAIIDKHWDVSFEDDYIPTCWEVKNCDKSDCPVHGKQNVRCWLVAGTFCRGEVQGKFAQKLGSCSKCTIYQTALAHNPVSEISENFYSLMWALREKEDMLGDAHDKLQGQYAELEEHHKKAKEMANTDGLTGLKNHGHFQR